MRRVAPILAVLIVLGAPSTAPAKEVSEVSVCGRAGECTTYDKTDFKSLMFLARDAGPTDPPRAAAAWYRVRFTVDEREHGGGYARWTVAFVPSAGVLRVRDDAAGFAWVAPNRRATRALRRAAAGLPPVAAARLRGLDARPPEAQVHQVFAPRRDDADADPGSPPWGWALAAAALVVSLALLARRLMRAEGLEPPQPKATRT